GDSVIQDSVNGQVLAVVKGVSANALLNTPGIFIEDNPQTGIIPPQGNLEFSSAEYTGTEGSTATITIERGINTAQGAVSADVDVLGGTATASADYTPFNQTVNFAPGQVSASFDVNLLADNVVDTGDTIRVLLSKPTGGAGLGPQDDATVTILDQGAIGGGGGGSSTFAFGGATFTATEGTAVVQAAITITRTGNTTTAGTVSFATSDGTATTAGNDYTAVTQTVNFAAGETIQIVKVPVLNDALTEGTETVNLTLSAPTGGTLGTQATAVLNIQDAAAVVTPPGSTANNGSLQFDGAANAFTVDNGTLSLFPNGINGGGGDDQFTVPAGSTGTVRLNGEAGNELIDGTAAAATSPIIADGGEGIDNIIGGAGGDTLRGGAGNDIITATAGNNTIVGGPGQDRMTAGGGIDTFAYQGSDGVASAAEADVITTFGATDLIGLGPDIASLAITETVVDIDGVGGANDLALSITNAGGQTQFLAVLVGVAPAAFGPANIVNVAADVFG
ncbi:MAG: Calx-beta domain-containing protein, partial [Cyanophyceae cyanobacterium]